MLVSVFCFIFVAGAQMRPASGRWERTLSGLHNKRKARVNSVGGLLGLLCWGHLCELSLNVEDSELVEYSLRRGLSFKRGSSSPGTEAKMFANLP